MALDQQLGQQSTPATYDVVVLGGGAAGLSGALTLGRAGRSVLVVDAGDPRNAPAAGVHNYLGREGVAPGELTAIGRAEAEAYGARFLAGTVTRAARRDDGFEVDLADGGRVRARRLLVATGVADQLPDVTGLAERWGRDVLHCPYCHGYEVRGEPIGILGTSPLAVHQALLWGQWSDRITLFTAVAGHRVALTSEQREELDARGVDVVATPVAGLQVTDDHLAGVALDDGSVRPVHALVVASAVEPHDGPLAELGLPRAEVRMADVSFGHVLEADATGATPVPGVWAAGNVADIRAQVISSAASGVNAAAMINMDLVQEEVRQAVAARRAPAPDAADPQQTWDELYRTRERFWSGRPNAVLEQMAAPLPPGRALDLGCGEGGDALWLASRGWQVLGVDVSEVALARVADAVRDAGLDDRITLQRTDVATDFPDGSFELVSAQFLHSPIAFPREQVLRRAAEAVAPGGVLLVVGHADVPPWGRQGGEASGQEPHGHTSHGHTSHAHTSHGHGAHAEAPGGHGLAEVPLPGPDEVLASLDLAEGAWEVLRCDLPERVATGPDGDEAVLHDSVLAVRRRAS